MNKSHALVALAVCLIGTSCTDCLNTVEISPEYTPGAAVKVPVKLQFSNVCRPSTEERELVMRVKRQIAALFDLAFAGKISESEYNRKQKMAASAINNLMLATSASPSALVTKEKKDVTVKEDSKDAEKSKVENKMPGKATLEIQFAKNVDWTLSNDDIAALKPEGLTILNFDNEKVGVLDTPEPVKPEKVRLKKTSTITKVITQEEAVRRAKNQLENLSRSLPAVP